MPRPKPDETALPDLKYLSLDKTPITSLEGNHGEIDDYQPRAHIKRRVKEGNLTLEDSESIVEFSKTPPCSRIACAKVPRAPPIA